MFLCVYFSSWGHEGGATIFAIPLWIVVPNLPVVATVGAQYPQRPHDVTGAQYIPRRPSFYGFVDSDLRTRSFVQHGRRSGVVVRHRATWVPSMVWPGDHVGRP